MYKNMQKKNQWRWKKSKKSKRIFFQSKMYIIMTYLFFIYHLQNKKEKIVKHYPIWCTFLKEEQMCFY